MVEDDDPREEVRGKADVVEHGQDRGAVALVEIDEELHHLDLVPEVEMDRRLVEDEDRRRLSDRHRQENELALPETQLPRVAAEEVPDADAVDRRGDRGAIGGTKASDRVLVRQATEGDDLLDGCREWQRRQLRDDGQAPGDAEAIEGRERRAGELDGPGGRLEEAGDCSEERGLTRAVRPDEARSARPPRR